MNTEELKALNEKISIISERALKDDEKMVLNLKIEGKSDKQIAAIQGVTTPSINQKKRKVYDMLKGWAWWVDNRKSFKKEIKEQIEKGVIPPDAVKALEFAIFRVKKNKIAEKIEVSPWKVSNMLQEIFSHYSGDDIRSKEFQRFIKSLKLGYKLPWQHKDEQKETEDKMATNYDEKEAVEEAEVSGDRFIEQSDNSEGGEVSEEEDADRQEGNPEEKEFDNPPSSFNKDAEDNKTEDFESDGSDSVEVNYGDDAEEDKLE